MSIKKPIVDKGIIIYYDYDFIFNFLTDEELGKTIRLLIETRDNPTLNPTDNERVNNTYNYIASRIIEYKKSKGLAVEWGKKGGNPKLVKSTDTEDTLKGTDKGGDKTGDKLIENKIIENKIIEKKKRKKEKKKKTYSDECVQCCDFLENIIKTKNGKNPLHVPKWKNDIDKLNRIDGVSWERIIKALQWYQDNIGGQYIPVIESGASLREKFIKLENAMSRLQNGTNSKKDNVKSNDDVLREYLATNNYEEENE